MPQSLVLNLVAQSAIPLQHLQGYSLQQLFFDLVDAVDPALGRVLRRDKRNESYGLSALQVQSESVPYLRSLKAPDPSKRPTLQYTHNNTLNPQTRCWWRISLLDDALLDHLAQKWTHLQNNTFQLGTASVSLLSIATDTHTAAWAGSCSYSDLYERASSHNHDIHLQFVTPTTFEQNGGTTPLPTADAVFQPLRKSWNRHSPLAFTPSLLSDIRPTDFDIQTRTVHSIRKNSLQTITGCTGQISFRIGNHSDSLIIKRINTLADFTQYCPIGFNTRLGMGVVKRLKTSQANISIKA